MAKRSGGQSNTVFDVGVQITQFLSGLQKALGAFTAFEKKISSKAIKVTLDQASVNAIGTSFAKSFGAAVKGIETSAKAGGKRAAAAIAAELDSPAIANAGKKAGEKLTQQAVSDANTRKAKLRAITGQGHQEEATASEAWARSSMQRMWTQVAAIEKAGGKARIQNLAKLIPQQVTTTKSGQEIQHEWQAFMSMDQSKQLTEKQLAAGADQKMFRNTSLVTAVNLKLQEILRGLTEEDKTQKQINADRKAAEARARKLSEFADVQNKRLAAAQGVTVAGLAPGTAIDASKMLGPTPGWVGKEAVQAKMNALKAGVDAAVAGTDALATNMKGSATVSNQVEDKLKRMQRMMDDANVPLKMRPKAPGWTPIGQPGSKEAAIPAVMNDYVAAAKSATRHWSADERAREAAIKKVIAALDRAAIDYGKIKNTGVMGKSAALAAPPAATRANALQYLTSPDEGRQRVNMKMMADMNVPIKDRLKTENAIAVAQQRQLVNSKGIESLNRGILGSLTDTAKRMGAWLVFYRLVRDAMMIIENGLRSIIQLGLEYTKQQETQLLGLTATLAEHFDVENSQKRQLNGAEKLSALQWKAKEEWAALQAASLAVVGQTGDLMMLYSGIIPYAGKLGKSLEQVMEMTKATAVAASVMDISFSDARTAIVSMLQGRALMKNRLVTLLGVSPDELKALKGTPELFDRVMNALRPFLGVSGQAEKTLASMTETFQEFIGMTGKAVEGPFVASFKELVNSMRQMMFEGSSSLTLKPVVAGIFLEIGRAAEYALTPLKKLGEELVGMGDENKYGIIGGLGTIVRIFTTLAATVIRATIAVSEFISKYGKLIVLVAGLAAIKSAWGMIGNIGIAATTFLTTGVSASARVAQALLGTGQAAKGSATVIVDHFGRAGEATTGLTTKVGGLKSAFAAAGPAIMSVVKGVGVMALIYVLGSLVDRIYSVANAYRNAKQAKEEFEGGDIFAGLALREEDLKRDKSPMRRAAAVLDITSQGIPNIAKTTIEDLNKTLTETLNTTGKIKQNFVIKAPEDAVKAVKLLKGLQEEFGGAVTKSTNEYNDLLQAIALARKAAAPLKGSAREVADAKLADLTAKRDAKVQEMKDRAAQNQTVANAQDDIDARMSKTRAQLETLVAMKDRLTLYAGKDLEAAKADTTFLDKVNNLLVKLNITPGETTQEALALAHAAAAIIDKAGTELPGLVANIKKVQTAISAERAVTTTPRPFQSEEPADKTFHSVWDERISAAKDNSATLIDIDEAMWKAGEKTAEAHRAFVVKNQNDLEKDLKTYYDNLRLAYSNYEKALGKKDPTEGAQADWQAQTSLRELKDANDLRKARTQARADKAEDIRKQGEEASALAEEFATRTSYALGEIPDRATTALDKYILKLKSIVADPEALKPLKAAAALFLAGSGALRPVTQLRDDDKAMEARIKTQKELLASIESQQQLLTQQLDAGTINVGQFAEQNEALQQAKIKQQTVIIEGLKAELKLLAEIARQTGRPEDAARAREVLNEVQQMTVGMQVAASVSNKILSTYSALVGVLSSVKDLFGTMLEGTGFDRLLSALQGGGKLTAIISQLKLFAVQVADLVRSLSASKVGEEGQDAAASLKNNQAPHPWVAAALTAAGIALQFAMDGYAKKVEEVAKRMTEALAAVTKAMDSGNATLAESLAATKSNMESYRYGGVNGGKAERKAFEQMEPEFERVIDQLQAKIKSVRESFEETLRASTAGNGPFGAFAKTLLEFQTLSKEYLGTFEAGSKEWYAAMQNVTQYYQQILEETKRNLADQLMGFESESLQSQQRVFDLMDEQQQLAKNFEDIDRRRVDLQKQMADLDEARIEKAKQERDLRQQIADIMTQAAEDESAIRRKGVLEAQLTVAEQKAGEIAKVRDAAQQQLAKAQEELKKLMKDKSLDERESDIRRAMVDLEVEYQHNIDAVRLNEIKLRVARQIAVIEGGVFGTVKDRFALAERAGQIEVETARLQVEKWKETKALYDAILAGGGLSFTPPAGFPVITIRVGDITINNSLTQNTQGAYGNGAGNAGHNPPGRGAGEWRWERYGY